MEKSKLKLLVGEDWFEILDNVLTPEIVFEIEGVRKQYADSKRIYPEAIKVWRVFNQCPLHKLRVVILGTEPYNFPKDQSTGLAFECGVKTSPTYNAFLDAFQDCYPSHFNTKVMDSYLQPWVDMGVLLLNTALTVKANTPNSHQQYWEKFSKKLLYTLYERDKDLIFITIGKQPLEYISHPLYKDANILTLDDPSLLKKNIKWEHKDFFLAVNRKLKSLDREEIDWNYEN